MQIIIFSFHIKNGLYSCAMAIKDIIELNYGYYLLTFFIVIAYNLFKNN